MVPRLGLRLFVIAQFDMRKAQVLDGEFRETNSLELVADSTRVFWRQARDVANSFLT